VLTTTLNYLVDFCNAHAHRFDGHFILHLFLTVLPGQKIFYIPDAVLPSLSCVILLDAVT